MDESIELKKIINFLKKLIIPLQSWEMSIIDHEDDIFSIDITEVYTTPGKTPMQFGLEISRLETISPNTKFWREDGDKIYFEINR